jgi:hypothetical protein
MFVDPFDSMRFWKVIAVYAPVRRLIRGLRMKVQDQRGIVSFIEHMELEVLLGVGMPGKVCPWSGHLYAEPRELNGPCMDDYDLDDDLYDRELELQSQGQLFMGMEIQRLVHLDRGIDRTERWYLNQYDDLGVSNIRRRWVRIESERFSGN